MGADLYLNPIYNENCKKYEPLFNKWVKKRDEATTEEAKKTAQIKVTYYYDKMNDDAGYFRDSYNCTSILWQYELSWWQDVGDKLCDKDGNLDADGIKALLAQLDKSKKIFKFNMEKILDGTSKKMDNASGYDSEKGRKEWVAYFIRRDKAFRKFLRKALESNTPIDCSL